MSDLTMNSVDILAQRYVAHVEAQETEQQARGELQEAENRVILRGGVPATVEVDGWLVTIIPVPAGQRSGKRYNYVVSRRFTPEDDD